MKVLLPSASFIVMAFIMSPLSQGVVQAQTPQENCENSTSETFLGFPTWYKYLDTEYENGSCNVEAITDPVTGDTDIGATAAAVLFAVIEVLLRVAGIAAVAYIVYGGILYSMSQGEPERVGSARKTIINGIIGVVVAVFAVAIVNLATNVLMG